MTLIEIKYAARSLSRGQLRKLDEWLHELIRRAEQTERGKKPAIRKQTIAEHALENKTYRLEGVRCGKEKCKCARGNLHGPYWYSYVRVQDKVTSQYIGKKLPKIIEKKLKGRTEE